MRTVLSGLALCFLAMAPIANAAVIFEDDFNHGQSATINWAVAPGSFTNWNITDGSVDAYTNGGFGLPCTSLGCLDLDGTTNNAATLETQQIFNFAAGETYRLVLLIGGAQRNAPDDLLGVSIAGFGINLSVPSASSISETIIDFSPASAQSTSLLLEHAGGDNFGVLLDKVTLSSLGNGNVPSPGTLALLGLGIAGFGLRRRQKPSV